MTASPRSQPAKRGARSWLAAAVVLVLLIAVGFAVGLMAGIVWEEPQLAYAYFSGETEDIAWSASAGEERTPAPAERETIADPNARRAELAADPKPTPDVAAGPVGDFAVQVGAFASSQAADGLANDLRAKGFPVYVSPGTKAGESRWRVRVGPVATRAEAEGAASRLKQVEKLPTWILKEDAS